jgi:hypothetical protein
MSEAKGLLPLPKDEIFVPIYPRGLERVASSETTATVFSVAVGCRNGTSAPLYTVEQVREYALATAAQLAAPVAQGQNPHPKGEVEPCPESLSLLDRALGLARSAQGERPPFRSSRCGANWKPHVCAAPQGAGNDSPASSRHLVRHGIGYVSTAFTMQPCLACSVMEISTDQDRSVLATASRAHLSYDPTSVALLQTGLQSALPHSRRASSFYKQKGYSNYESTIHCGAPCNAHAKNSHPTKLGMQRWCIHES